MRHCLGLLLLLGLCGTVFGAPDDEVPTAEPAVKQAADAVVAAAKASDAATLKTLAEIDDPDPWLVADLLCARGEPAAAEAFAKASLRVALKSLPAYVAAQRGRDPQTASRQALADARLSIAEGKLEAAFSQIDGVSAGGDSVFASYLSGSRGNLLQNLDRHDEAAREYTSAAEIAARIGWTAQAANAHFLAGHTAYHRSDYRRALECWQRALPFMEAGDNHAALAGTIQNIAVVHKALGDWKQALAFHERALKLREASGDKADIAQSLASLGAAHGDFGDLEKSLELNTRALRLREEVGEPAAIGRSHASIGQVHQARGAIQKALDSLTRALALQRAAQDDVGASNTLANLGLAHAALGETKKALAFEAEARALLGGDEQGHRVAIAQIKSNVGWIHYTRGDYGRALEFLGSALEMASEVGEVRLEATIVATLGAAHLRLGDYPRAMGLLVRAQKTAERLGDRMTQAAVLGQIGEIHRLLGEYPRAMETQERAQRLAEGSGDRASLAAILGSTAAIYFSLGDLRKARDLYERARDLAESLGRRSYVATCLRSLGAVRARMKDPGGAIEQHAKALAIQEELGDRPGIVETLANLADIHVREGRPEKALPLLERSLRIREEMKDRVGIAVVFAGLGDAHRALKDPAKALAFYERAALEGDRLGVPDLLVDVLTGAAEAHLDLGQAALALEKAKRAASYVDRMTRGQGEEQGASVQEQYVRLYDAGTRAAALLGNVGEAAFFLETGRAGTLLESLGGREMLQSWSLTPELLAAETKARADESAALHAYTDALDTGEREPIQARKRTLDDARSSLQEVIERITRESKSAIIVHPKAATLAEMQGFLEATDALVLYWLLPDEAVALVITPGDAKLVRLGKTAEIVAACEALTLADPTSDPTKPLAAVKALAVANLGLTAKTTRVLVSSDGALSYVPFSLLIPDRLVAYVPSGTVYGALREERKRKGDGVLALGDPDYRVTDAKSVALVRGGLRLVSLPGTRAEAQAVGDVLLLGAQATSPALKEAVATRPHWRAIHLGCHGLVDPDQPMRCSLALTPTASDSGFLTAQDLCRLKMPTDLAVLSACETMKGKIYRGEGILGVSRMFLYAGASRLIVSLWKVDDDATRALMTKFYELWNPKDGSKPAGTAAALAAAQAHVRSQPKWSHPYYWAAWVLWGLPD